MTIVAIMQPYVLPYLGYYQLAHAADHFVFYDDVQFMKGGWVNRNRITNQGRAHVFTIPAQGGSIHARIMDVSCGVNDKFRRKFLRQVEQEYRKAPMFEPVLDLLRSILESDHDGNMARLAVRSVTAVFDYLDLSFTPILSSREFPRDTDIKGPARVIAVTHALGGTRYLNLPGGVTLYDEAEFAAAGIDLRFIRDCSAPYPQFADPFIPRLSILDVLMHNSPAQVREMLDDYEVMRATEMVGQTGPEEPPS